MSVRPIVRLGHPALRSVAQALAPGSLVDPAVQELIDDMIATMRTARGVGLAAPQIGISLQLFVYEMAPPIAAAADAAHAAGTAPSGHAGPAEPVEPGEPGPADGSYTPADTGDASGQADRPEAGGAAVIPLHVVVNPMLTPQAGELIYDWEGCLSIPDLRGLVPRHPAVRVRGLDREGRPVDYVAQGFEARIVQHEFDHLNGVVFLDRMRDLKALAFREEWERYMAAGAAAPPDPLDPRTQDPAPSGEPPAVAPEPVPAGDPALI